MASIITFEEYFKLIDQEMIEILRFDYPKLETYYCYLKKSFTEVTCTEPLNAIGRILAIDAQIQILREYLRWDLLKIFSQEDVIERIKEDSCFYYREKTGLRPSDKIPLEIMFLGDHFNKHN